MECGAGNYLDLMKNYPIVCSAFRRLEPEYQDVITDICRRMGEGMAEFIEKDVSRCTEFGACVLSEGWGWLQFSKAGTAGLGAGSKRGVQATWTRRWGGGPPPMPSYIHCPRNPCGVHRSRPSRITTSTATTWPGW